MGSLDCWPCINCISSIKCFLSWCLHEPTHNPATPRFAPGCPGSRPSRLGGDAGLHPGGTRFTGEVADGHAWLACSRSLGRCGTASGQGLALHVRTGRSLVHPFMSGFFGVIRNPSRSLNRDPTQVWRRCPEVVVVVVQSPVPDGMLLPPGWSRGETSSRQ